MSEAIWEDAAEMRRQAYLGAARLVLLITREYNRPSHSYTYLDMPTPTTDNELQKSTTRGH